MSSSDEEEEGDSLSDIDFSVISTSIKVGGTMVNQMLNSINYGSPEVRYLLQEECDVIIECKVCRNLFRSVPMFVAHKRIYCQQFSASSKETIANLQPEEEVVVVQPQSPDDPVENEGQGQAKSTVDHLIEGTFHGTSEAYRLYTKAAQRVESQKTSKTLSTINVTEIPTNPNAVQISVQNSVINQSEIVLQNGLEADDEHTQAKKKSETNENQSELMKELTKTNEKSPEILKDKIGKPDSNLNVDSKKGKNLGKNIELRPVKSQDATLSELKELENMGHCDIKKIKCLICYITFVSKKGLLQHMHSQHSGRKTVYPCYLCKSKFSYFWGLTRHLKVGHEKTKEQIDKMREKLRAKAYTISVDSGLREISEKNEKEKSKESQNEVMETTSPSDSSEKAKKVSRTPGGIILNKCEGCGKAFWKRQSYDEHTKLCKWLTTSSSSTDILRSRKTRKSDANLLNGNASTPSKNEAGNEQKIGEKNKKESPVLQNQSLSDSQKSVPERFIKTRSESKNRDDETRARSESNDSRNSSRDAKFTQENRSRSGSTRDAPKTKNRNHVESARSESRDESDISRNSSRERSESLRSVSRERKGSLSLDVTEKQMVTRNIATRRGESEKKPASSKNMNEKSLNKSRKSDEIVQDSNSETVSKNDFKDVSGPRRIGTRSSNIGSTAETDEVDGSGKKVSTSPLFKTGHNQNSDIKDGSKNEKGASSVDITRLYSNTRRSDVQKSKDRENLTSRTSSRNSSVDRDLGQGSRKIINTRSSDVNSKLNAETFENSESSYLNHGETQGYDETVSDISGTGNTYIIDGVEISEVTEAQINVCKTPEISHSDVIDHPSDFEDANDNVSINETAESKHYLRSSQKENAKVGNTEITVCHSSENVDIESGSPNDKKEKSSSNERKSRTSSESSQKNSPSTKSSSNDKRSTENDTKNKKSVEESTNENIVYTPMKHVLRSHGKGDSAAKTKDEKQLPSSNISVENSLFDQSMEMLEAQETINSLQSFPDIQMITRRSLETICPKDEESVEEKPEDAHGHAVETRKSERQKSLAVSDNKNKDSVAEISPKPIHSKKSNTVENAQTIYPCIFCSREFSYYWGLTRHLRINHRKSKQQTVLLWTKLKAKSYTVSKKMAVKRINKTRPMKVEQDQMKLRLRHSSKFDGTNTVKKGDNMQTRSQKTAKKNEQKLNKNTKQGSRKDAHDMTENNSPVANQTTKASPKSDSSISSPKSLKSLASGARTSSRVHDSGQTTTYNTRKSSDQSGSGIDKPTEKIKVTDISPKVPNSTSEKLYHGQEINSNSNKVCIEEIWVGKEPGQPSKSIRCQKVFIESESGKSLLSKMTVRRRKSQRNSPKSKEKGNRKMYVVDPTKSSQPRCLDSKRVDALICENHNTAEQYCLQCGMVFSNVSNLRRHIVRHLGWKRYKCKLCSFASYNKSECSTHLRRIHTEKLIGGSVQSYVIDLNKEASKLRTEKKQNTLSLRKTDLASGSSTCKSYWYRDRNAKRIPLKITSRGDNESGDIENANDSPKKKSKTTQKKNEDRRKPGIKIENIKQLSTGSQYNISTRNSSRTFDTSPYKEVDEMKTLMTRQGHYPKEEKISLRSKRDILSDIDNEDVLPTGKQNSKTKPSPQVETDSQTSKVNSGADSVREKPVVRKRKRSDSEGHSPNETENNEKSEKEVGTKTSPTGSKTKVLKQNEVKWKLKRSFSHDGIPSSQVSNEKNAESEDTDGGEQSNPVEKYSELRQAETEVRLVPSLKTMMAALEEARATIKKRGRGMKRSISPVKKFQRLNSADPSSDRFRRHSLDVAVSSKTQMSVDGASTDCETVDENVDNCAQSGEELGARDEDSNVEHCDRIEEVEKEKNEKGDPILPEVSDSSQVSENNSSDQNKS